jgi:transcriptional regulator with XRE-family HTH domain
MEDASLPGPFAGAPEFTELGKRIETIRIERGLSKQHLARHAGTSRQQLWRVMTGKCELTVGLKARIADALRIPTLDLDATGARRSARTRSTTVAAAGALEAPLAPLDVASYLHDLRAVARTLATMPAGDGGRTLKRKYLDALEDAAVANGHSLDARFFDLRRRVIAGQL